MHYELQEILNLAKEKKASDIHLTVGKPPILRVNSELITLGDEKLTPVRMEELCYLLLDEEKRRIFESEGEVDFSWSNVNRYRVNVFRQRGSCAAALRIINHDIPLFKDLGLPDILENLSLKPRGLVLVTGPTGTGKSTTLAAMMGYINMKRNCHILTIEEPIEYTHKHGNSIVNQREVGGDTKSFSNALRAALREDPDVILVGEMRDLETISTAISAAETGHFVMSTLHTSSAAQTVDRIIDVFPPHQQLQVRNQLSMILQGIICQQLVKTTDGKSLVPALEILLVNDAARNLIREGKTQQLETVLQTNIKNGMLPMDYSLAELVKKRRITYEKALERCVDKKIFQHYIDCE